MALLSHGGKLDADFRQRGLQRGLLLTEFRQRRSRLFQLLVGLTARFLGFHDRLAQVAACVLVAILLRPELRQFALRAFQFLLEMRKFQFQRAFFLPVRGEGHLAFLNRRPDPLQRGHLLLHGRVSPVGPVLGGGKEIDRLQKFPFQLGDFVLADERGERSAGILAHE